MPDQQNPDPIDSVTEIAGVPLNRIVAFVGPYASLVSGAVASWLLVHVHVLGLFHFQHDGLASGIAQGIVFLVTALLTWAGHSKWLTGHQSWEAEVARTVRVGEELGLISLPAADVDGAADADGESEVGTPVID